MKKRERSIPIKLAVALLSVGMIGAALAACSKASNAGSSNGNSPATSGTIIIGTSADFPPMEFRDPSNPNQFSGFEIDMMKSIMGHMGLKYEWRDMNFNGLIPAVQAGQVQMVVSDVYDTPAREQQVSFVDYIESSLSVMVTSSHASKVHDFMGLCGEPLGILSGAATELQTAQAASKQCTSGGKPAINIQAYPAVSDEVQAVRSGHLYAMLEDLVTVSYTEKKNPGVFATAFAAPGTQVRSGIILPKGSSLIPKVQAAFQWYKSSGQYAKDLQKWGLPTSMEI